MSEAKPVEITEEEAKRVLSAQAQERKTRCQDAINSVLSEFGFRIAVGMMITEQGAKSVLDLVETQK